VKFSRDCTPNFIEIDSVFTELFKNQKGGFFRHNVKRVAKKLAHFVLYALTSSSIDRFSTYLTVRIMGTFVIILSVKIPPHVKCVTILPCEISVFQKHQLKT